MNCRVSRWGIHYSSCIFMESNFKGNIHTLCYFVLFCFNIKYLILHLSNGFLLAMADFFLHTGPFISIWREFGYMDAPWGLRDWEKSFFSSGMIISISSFTWHIYILMKHSVQNKLTLSPAHLSLLLLL